MTHHSLTPNVVGQYSRKKRLWQQYDKVIQRGVTCQPTSIEATKGTGNQSINTATSERNEATRCLNQQTKQTKNSKKWLVHT